MSNESINIDVISDLTQAYSEEIAGQVASQAPPAAVHLNLVCDRVAPGAGWRLGNALRRLAPPASRLRVTLPVLASDPGYLSGSWWYLCLTRSGLGFAIAKYAAEVHDTTGHDITDSTREYFRDHSALASNNAIGVYSFSAVQDLAADEGTFYRTVDRWLDDIGAKEQAHEDDLDAIGRLSWEGVTNIDDHSSRRPLPKDSPLLASMTVRWYRPGMVRKNPPSRRWMLATFDPLHQEQESLKPLQGFVEIVIADDGVGIAARQGQDSAIYWRPLATERAAVASALAEQGTIKLKTHDTQTRGEPGFGFTKIESRLKQLGAWATLRTGRLMVACDGSHRGTGSFLMADNEAAYVPGTALEVLIPIRGDAPPKRGRRAPTDISAGLLSEVDEEEVPSATLDHEQAQLDLWSTPPGD